MRSIDFRGGCSVVFATEGPIHHCQHSERAKVVWSDLGCTLKMHRGLFVLPLRERRTAIELVGLEEIRVEPKCCLKFLLCLIMLTVHRKGICTRSARLRQVRVQRQCTRAHVQEALQRDIGAKQEPVSVAIGDTRICTCVVRVDLDRSHEHFASSFKRLH